MANYNSTNTGANIDSAVDQIIDSTTDLNIDSNTLVVDKSANAVGIGTTSPANESSGTLLHIADTGGTNAAHINLSGGTGGDGNQTGKISFSDPGDTDDAVAFISCNVEGTNANPGGSLHFFTTPDAGSPTERVTIHEDGNVGIGTASPAKKLDCRVSASGDYIAAFYNTPDTSDAYGIKVQCGQQAGSGTTYFFKALESDAGDTGDLRTVSGTFQLSDNSDSRLKDNIRDTEINGLDTVNSMKVRDFEWKKNESTVLAGFVAQELKESFEPASPDDEDAVDEDGIPIMMAISRERLVPVLVKAIQELSAKVEALENA
mgnify:CR=1 FL=1